MTWMMVLFAIHFTVNYDALQGSYWIRGSWLLCFLSFLSFIYLFILFYLFIFYALVLIFWNGDGVEVFAWAIDLLWLCTTVVVK